jgi:hypothetical protein
MADDPMLSSYILIKHILMHIPWKNENFLNTMKLTRLHLKKRNVCLLLLSYYYMWVLVFCRFQLEACVYHIVDFLRCYLFFLENGFVNSAWSEADFTTMFSRFTAIFMLSTRYMTVLHAISFAFVQNATAV